MRVVISAGLLLPCQLFAQQVDGVSVSSVARVPTVTIAPDYPREARRDRIEGDVEVCFNIDHAGRPHRISVRRSDHRAFERPSVRAVRASRYAAIPRTITLSGIKTCRLFQFRLKPAPG